MSQDVVIIGASTRAAAFSALRAGWKPWCVDLFADQDLCRVCPIQRVSAKGYPRNILRHLAELPTAPCIYTGALENHPQVLAKISTQRPLWGNGPDVLRRCRSPMFLQRMLEAEGLPFLRVFDRVEGLPAEGRWLTKPLAGAGGSRIEFVSRETPRRAGVYFQEFAEGEARAAIFVGDAQRAKLIGVTKQLIGCSWLNAAPFHYSGSIGPLRLNANDWAPLQRLGDVLARQCGLRGLFGVDYIQRDGLPYLVEVNPRYTASVEILEIAYPMSAFECHRQSLEGQMQPLPTFSASGWWGKAILYAPQPFDFPDMPLPEPIDLWRLPTIADIPAAGEHLESGMPILTCFSEGLTQEECLTRLQAHARDLDHLLFKDNGEAGT